MNIHRVTIKVRPDPKHPKYWEFQFGFLHMFLLDDEPDNAARRALAILGQLPYEKIGERIAIYSETGTTHDQAAQAGQPWREGRILEASHSGFASLFEAWLTGRDETAFVNAPFPEEGTIFNA